MIKPIIAVIGSTGAQGGGLVRAILSDPDRKFAVRAITRKINSAAARELATLGAEVAFGDLDDRASLERAFAGAHGLFAVTNFWEHFSPEREYAQAENIAHAAGHADVSHVVWSTLEDTREQVPLYDTRMPTLMQRYKVPHLDAKGEADILFRPLPTTFLRTSFYWDNLIHFGMGPRRGEDGVLNFLLPMGDYKLSGIASSDIGACAFGIFNGGSGFIGQTIGIAGDHLTGSAMSEELSVVLGERVRHVTMPHAVYAQLGFPGAEDLANMFQYYCEFNEAFRAQRPLALSRKLHPGLLSFRQWLAVHRDQLRASVQEKT